MAADCFLLAEADSGLCLCWLCPVKPAFECCEADLDLADSGFHNCGDEACPSSAALATQGLAGTEAKDWGHPVMPSDGLYAEAHLGGSCEVGGEVGTAEAGLGEAPWCPLGSRGRLPVTSGMSWSMSKTAAISCQLPAAQLPRYFLAA